jgi:hypothetical protein
VLVHELEDVLLRNADLQWVSSSKNGVEALALSQVTLQDALVVGGLPRLGHVLQDVPQHPTPGVEAPVLELLHADVKPCVVANREVSCDELG